MSATKSDLDIDRLEADAAAGKGGGTTSTSSSTTHLPPAAPSSAAALQQASCGLHASASSSTVNSVTATGGGGGNSTNRLCSDLSGGEFKLLWRRTMPDPIFYVNGIDITGDGLKEVVVLSLKGLHILQVMMHPV